MAKNISCLVLLTFLAASAIQAQTIWNGPSLTFTKSSGSNANLPANQDRITATTWLTRGLTQGLFNIVSETSYSDISPQNTEWATGPLANFASLTYSPWRQWNSGNPTATIGVQSVVHLITENIYIGITFLSWGQGGGGGFSYQRTTAAIPIPIKLVSFTATRKDHVILLNWKTANEEKTERFTLERSVNGQHFTEIGGVSAAGYSTSERQYSFTDIAPLPVSFYRLRTTDIDGAFSYSSVLVFKMERQTFFKIFPNPTSFFLRVQWKNVEKISAQLINSKGQIVKQMVLPAGQSSTTIEIAELNPGIYYLKAGTELKKFIKE